MGGRPRARPLSRVRVRPEQAGRAEPSRQKNSILWLPWACPRGPLGLVQVSACSEIWEAQMAAGHWPLEHLQRSLRWGWAGSLGGLGNGRAEHRRQGWGAWHSGPGGASGRSLSNPRRGCMPESELVSAKSLRGRPAGTTGPLPTTPEAPGQAPPPALPRNLLRLHLLPLRPCSLLHCVCTHFTLLKRLSGVRALCPLCIQLN